MIVCVCRRVSDRDIARAVKSGCTDFAALQRETGVSTCCGACRSCAEETFQHARSALVAELTTASIARAEPVHALQAA